MDLHRISCVLHVFRVPGLPVPPGRRHHPHHPHDPHEAKGSGFRVLLSNYVSIVGAKRWQWVTVSVGGRA